MGWQELKAKYEAGVSATEQSVEDMVARRVLRGLGLVEREFPRLEKAVLGEGRYDEPLWSRVEKLLRVALKSKRMGELNIETLKTNGKHTDVVERYEDAKAESLTYSYTVYLTRVGKTKNTRAYFLSDMSGDPTNVGVPPYLLIPPFTVEATVGRLLLVTQDIETFIKQFGPYDWSSYAT